MMLKQIGVSFLAVSIFSFGVLNGLLMNKHEVAGNCMRDGQFVAYGVTYLCARKP